jgi:hypothetical protein
MKSNAVTKQQTGVNGAYKLIQLEVTVASHGMFKLQNLNTVLLRAIGVKVRYGVCEVLIFRCWKALPCPMSSKLVQTKTKEKIETIYTGMLFELIP